MIRYITRFDLEKDSRLRDIISDIATGDIEIVKERVIHVENDIEELNDSVSTLDTTITEHTNSIETLNNDVNGINSAINNIESDVYSIEENVNSIEDDVDYIEATLNPTTLSINAMACSGFVTDGAKNIYFFIPVTIGNGTNASISNLSVNIRSTGNGTSTLVSNSDVSSYITSITTTPYGLYVKLVCDSLFTYTPTNNAPVSVQIRGCSITIS